jgi:hypothetical protein
VRRTHDSHEDSRSFGQGFVYDEDVLTLVYVLSHLLLDGELVIQIQSLRMSTRSIIVDVSTRASRIETSGTKLGRLHFRNSLPLTMLTSMWEDFTGVGIATNSRLGSNVSPFSMRSLTEISTHAPEDNQRRIT